MSSFAMFGSSRVHHIARPATPLLVGVVAMISLSCNDVAAPRGPGQPASLQIMSGNQQEGVVAERLPEPLVVRVVDDGGHPVAGQIVNWVVTAGGGSVFAGAALTNAEGLAFEYWTIGPYTYEENVLEVRAVHPETRAPIVYARFTARGLAGAPVGIQTASTVPTTYTVGQVMTPPPTVRVRDAYGNLVSDAEVTFEVVSGGGSVSPATAATNADGLASTTWTLGFQVGTHQMRASIPGGAFVDFATNVLHGSVTAGLVFVQPPSATAKSYEPFPQQPIVRLIDESGAPVQVAGVPVSVVLGSGNGWLDGTKTVTTDAEGIARFTNLYIRSYDSRFTLNFFKQGSSTPLSHTITVPPWNYTLQKLAGDGLTVARGSSIEVKVQLMDNDTGQPVTGQRASAWVKSGGGSVSGSPVWMDEQGIATFRWTLGASAGTNELQVWVNDVIPVVFTATGK